MQRALAFAQVEAPRQEQQRWEASVMEGLGACRRVLQVRNWYKSMHALSPIALLHCRTSWPANACMSRAAAQRLRCAMWFCTRCCIQMSTQTKHGARHYKKPFACLR